MRLLEQMHQTFLSVEHKIGPFYQKKKCQNYQGHLLLPLRSMPFINAGSSLSKRTVLFGLGYLIVVYRLWLEGEINGETYLGRSDALNVFTLNVGVNSSSILF
jgi:hypothetical protein